MKITTLNYKHDDYKENHEIFVGTRTGTFKKICVAEENPYSQKNLQDLKTLTKDSQITALAYGDENFNEILIGRENKFVQTYSNESSSFESIQEFEEGPIVGVARFNDKIIAGIGTGKIQQQDEPKSVILKTGDNISKMVQCPSKKSLIATGGKERQNNLKIFDMIEAKEIFKSKNLPNDYLQLEVPIWDSSLDFIDSNLITTCSRYGYVRVYDIRKQRRPILNYTTPEEQMSFCSLIAKENFIYCGSTMGIVKAFDIRKFKNFVHTYKGFTGSVSDLCLDKNGKYLFSSCLDRYVRVHQTDNCVMLYQCYVKSKATRIIAHTGQNITNEANNDIEKIDNIEENEANLENCSDDEYDEMFEHMPKISDSNREDISISSKRKGTDNIKKTKKKKIVQD